PRHQVGERLVHAQDRALDVAADVGDAGELQQALDRAVLAMLAVQEREDDVEPEGLPPARPPDQGPAHAPVRRQHGLASALDAGLGTVAQSPLAVPRDAHPDELVPRSVQAPPDLASGPDRDVVLLRGAAEEDPDPRPTAYGRPPPRTSRSRPGCPRPSASAR